MQEEVENRSVNFAVKSAKVTAKVLYRALRAYVRHVKKKSAEKKMTPEQGEKSVKELIGQGQGVASIPIGEELRDFKRCANKYGVDFAIVKDKTNNPPVHTVFFKARDADAIELVLKDYGDILMKKGKITDKASVLEKLHKYKEQVKNTPRKDKEKRKDIER